MASLIARIIGYTNHRTVERSSRLAEQKVCLEANTWDAATMLNATLFHDGSGVLLLERGNVAYRLIWDQEGYDLGLSVEINKQKHLLSLAANAGGGT